MAAGFLRPVLEFKDGVGFRKEPESIWEAKVVMADWSAASAGKVDVGAAQLDLRHLVGYHNH